MKCPKCGSTKSKGVSCTDRDYTGGARRCQGCNHQAHWTHFCDPPLPKKLLVETTGYRPDALITDLQTPKLGRS
jgi:hypothetical protein